MNIAELLQRRGSVVDYLLGVVIEKADDNNLTILKKTFPALFKLWPEQDKLKIIHIALSMKKYGGSFEQALGALLEQDNLFIAMIIKDVFSDLWEQHSETTL